MRKQITLEGRVAEIRTLTAEDVDALLELQEIGWENLPCKKTYLTINTRKTFLESIDEHNGITVSIFIKDRLIGKLTLWLHKSKNHHRFINIKRLPLKCYKASLSGVLSHPNFREHPLFGKMEDVLEHIASASFLIRL